MMKTVVPALAVVAVAGGAWFMTRPAAPADTIISNALETVNDVAKDVIPDMVLGNPDAPVEVIEYASYTCPHCATFHANQFTQIKENYVDTDQVRFVYREVFFDQPGLWASMVARCGGETRFFGITSVIYEQQSRWARAGDGAAVAAALRNIGKVAGLTENELDACLSDAETAQNLVGWFRANAAEHNIDSTPSFIINGEKYQNMSYEAFAAVLDEKLAEAAN